MFLVFFIPGTPKDLLTYFVGLTEIKLGTFLAISLVARIPSVVTSTFGGHLLGEGEYVLAIIIYAVTAVVSLLGMLGYNAWMKRRESKERRKTVISYGVSGAYSGMLREAASETNTLPGEEEIYLHYRDYILDNLAFVVDNGKIIPTFTGTIEAVSENHGLQPQAVKNVLKRLIDEGYIYQRPHSFGIGKTVKRLAANWDRFIAEGLFIVHDS